MRQSETDTNSGLVGVDHRVVVIASVIGESYGLVVGLKDALERVLGLGAVFVHFDGSIVDLGHGNYFDVIAVAILLTLATHIVLKVLRHVLLEIVSIFGLHITIL